MWRNCLTRGHNIIFVEKKFPKIIKVISKNDCSLLATFNHERPHKNTAKRKVNLNELFKRLNPRNHCCFGFTTHREVFKFLRPLQFRTCKNTTFAINIRIKVLVSWRNQVTKSIRDIVKDFSMYSGLVVSFNEQLWKHSRNVGDFHFDDRQLWKTTYWNVGVFHFNHRSQLKADLMI